MTHSTSGSKKFLPLSTHGRLPGLWTRIRAGTLVGLSTKLLPEQKLLRFEDIASVFLPWHEQGEPTVSCAIQHIPSHARYFVLRHGDHCALFHTSQGATWPLPLAAASC